MNSSVVLITNKENSGFGTGFIIHKDRDFSYILTCLHVVDNTPNSLLIDYNIEAKIIAEGSSKGIDLAVLKAKIEDKKPLELMNSSCIDFRVIGCKSYHKDTHAIEPIICSFNKNVDLLTPRGRVKSFKINISREDNIVSGYSGSPVICKNNGRTIAVISDKQGSKDAYAISIEHLKDIWKDIPIELQWEKEYRLILTSKTDKSKIFISYMYSDIEEERWLLKLLKSLKNILTRRLEQDNDFFKISYQKYINIKEEINTSTTHLILLSNKYIKSKEHLNELENIRLYSNNMMILEYEELSIPIITDIKKNFKFWCENEDNHFDLTEDIIASILKYIENTSIKKEYSHKIFLAKTTDDLEFYRNEIVRYLEYLNYDIYPKKIYPQDKGFEFKEAVENDMKDCEFFIQLLSQYTREAPSDLKEGYSKTQFNIAKKFKVPILQWSEQINLKSVKNKIQKELLSTEFIQIVPIEEFKRMIEYHVEEISKRLKKDKSEKNHKDLIFINFCHQEPYDKKIAKKIYDSLYDEKQITLKMPKSNMKPSELSEYIDNSLLMCDYYILIYGHTSLFWINKQLITRFYKIKNKREKEISSIIIYDTSPREKEEISFNAPYIKTIDGREIESIHKIQNFISKRRNP